ncbi:shikimate kinase [Chitinophaga silvisoli]|uniref:Shikimate kinase n=1 Tax=Chitinophaga silvisoli TaxID=2291814 RepID=A0A3E1NY29_9BACT|nr:shikimate kinase [Chitinophaga silvisoli]RFM32754.1 shikimate kinase [Chitinophaga silvisoli]
MKIFLLGFMGAGKSYWGKQLAEHLKLPFYDLDDVIVESEEMSISDIFATKGEDYFRQKESFWLRELSEADNFLISCGGGVPCFQDNMDVMNERGTTIWLNPELPVIVDRLKRKKAKRPLIADLPDDEILAFVEKKLAERQPFYQQAQITIAETDNVTLDTFTKRLNDNA